MIPPAQWELLRRAALEARDRAYAPYSRFPVGAALLTEEGEVVLGCNVENISFGLTVCAERVALWSALAQGLTPQAMVVVADTEGPVRPCGACRQVLAEFAPEMPLLLTNLKGDQELIRVTDLLPLPFQHDLLGREGTEEG